MILTQDDIQTLEGFADESSGYFAAMIRFLDKLIANGLREGRFTDAEVRSDRDIALWYSYAWNNEGGYSCYRKTAQWMPASEENARGCGAWYYRYAVALMYCGEPELSREYHEKGTREEPAYPWNWLQLGKLRAHFGDKAGALTAVEKGLSLVPGDHEFLTLEQELQAGRTLPEMGNHYIDPQADQSLQEQVYEDEQDRQQAIQKLWDIAGILADPAGLERNRELLRPLAWNTEDPDGLLRCTVPVEGGEMVLRFRFNEAAFSRLDPQWVSGLRDWMDRRDFPVYTTYREYRIAEYEVGLDGWAKGIFREAETQERYISCSSGQPTPPPPAL